MGFGQYDGMRKCGTSAVVRRWRYNHINVNGICGGRTKDLIEFASPRSDVLNNYRWTLASLTCADFRYLSPGRRGRKQRVLNSPAEVLATSRWSRRALVGFRSVLPRGKACTYIHLA